MRLSLRWNEDVMTTLEPSRSGDARGARALFVFHASLLAFWAFVQVFHRAAPSSVVAVSKLPFGIASLVLIVAALVVTTHFALGQRGTPAGSAARVAVVLAVID